MEILQAIIIVNQSNINGCIPVFYNNKFVIELKETIMPERKAWSSEEDEVLKNLREEQQITKWSVIAKKMAEEYNMPGRTGKQCRERYKLE